MCTPRNSKQVPQRTSTKKYIDTEWVLRNNKIKTPEATIRESELQGCIQSLGSEFSPR